MIRKLSRLDAEQYKTLRLLALQTDPDAYFSTYEEVAKQSIFSFAGEIHSDHHRIYGYYGFFDDEKNLLGYISIQIPYFPKQGHTADLYNLYVHPEHRTKGVASALVCHIMELVKRQPNVESIFLTVMGSNAHAIKFYKKMGFVQFARKEKSIKTTEKYLDEVFMRWDK